MRDYSLKAAVRALNGQVCNAYQARKVAATLKRAVHFLGLAGVDSSQWPLVHLYAGDPIFVKGRLYKFVPVEDVHYICSEDEEMEDEEYYTPTPWYAIERVR